MGILKGEEKVGSIIFGHLKYIKKVIVCSREVVF